MWLLRKKSVLLLLTLASLWQVSFAGIRNYQVAKTDCLNWSLSVWQKTRPSVSLPDCFVSSRSFYLGSVGVVQRNKRDASCALFRFSQVCRLLRLINITSPSTGDDKMDCEIVVDSEYDAVTANKHFDAVWVGDRGPQLENVVCGSDGPKNPMRSSNVTWTSEGARMDGVSSRLWVDDPSGLDFNSSFTWVIQLKRAPKSNCFIELTNCDSLSMQAAHFWEYSFQAGVSKALYFNAGKPTRFQTGSVMPTDPEQLSMVGVAYDRSNNDIRFYFGSDFLPTVQYKEALLDDYPFGACIKVGWRGYNDGVLNGAVKAVAVSKALVPGDLIRQLTQQV